MAELNVEKKSGLPWWIWLVIGLVVLGLIIFLLAGNNQTDADHGDRDRHHDDTVRRSPTTQMVPAPAEWDYVSMQTQYPSLEEFPFDQH
jgi:hypothetical protein